MHHKHPINIIFRSEIHAGLAAQVLKKKHSTKVQMILNSNDQRTEMLQCTCSFSITFGYLYYFPVIFAVNLALIEESIAIVITHQTPGAQRFLKKYF